MLPICIVGFTPIYMLWERFEMAGAFQPTAFQSAGFQTALAASFPFPLAKIDIINSALVETGNNIVAMANDGSDEWNVGSPAYDRAIAYVMESHSWGYATQNIVLTPSSTPPQDTDFDTAYPIPPDCIHIIWVKINFNNPNTSNIPQLTLWKIAGTQAGPVIVVNARGGPPPPLTPVTPAQVTMFYISNAGALCQSTFGTPTLILALVSFVMSGVYRGLHEDIPEADKMWMAGDQMLQRARTLYDQQKPKRQFFNSRIGAVRRIRRPWPQVGINNWGSGSGSAGTPG
jgi:hypothetical protein